MAQLNSALSAEQRRGEAIRQTWDDEKEKELVATRERWRAEKEVELEKARKSMQEDMQVKIEVSLEVNQGTWQPLQPAKVPIFLYPRIVCTLL